MKVISSLPDVNMEEEVYKEHWAWPLCGWPKVKAHYCGRCPADTDSHVAPATSLGSLFLCSTILRVRKCFPLLSLTLLWCSFVPFPSCLGSQEQSTSLCFPSAGSSNEVTSWPFLLQTDIPSVLVQDVPPALSQLCCLCWMLSSIFNIR